MVVPNNVVENLGQQLAALGIVTPEQVEKAVLTQNETGEKLGSIFVRLGFCAEEDVARALARRSGFKFISLNNQDVDINAANLITPAMAIKYNALPISRDENTLYVGMLNTNDVVAIDDLQLHTRLRIKPVVVPDSELAAAIENFAMMSAGIDEESADDEASQEPALAEAGEGEERPIVQLVNQILNIAVRAGASDVHIEPAEKIVRVRFRLDGVLHNMMQLNFRTLTTIVSRIKVIGGMDVAEKRIPQDGRATVALSGQIIDIRIASLPTVYGEKITMRLLVRSDRLITMEELGFSAYNKQRFLEMMHKPYGFILVTGPTGSGKSTTLYAALMEVSTDDKNVITLEDPVERNLAGLNQIQINERAGMMFSSALRSIIRNDPDIIMLGEIRDSETAKIAVEAALTGHMVFSTLHTNDAPSTISRLDEMGIEPFLTASSLVAVVAQRLIRTLCPRCREAYTLTRQEVENQLPGFELEPGQERATLYRGKGCISCNNTGYKGRRGVFELLIISEEIQKLILSHASASEIRNAAVKGGMITLRQDGLEKVRQGITSVEELLRVIV
jgi:type IV pilus assembly protein PilB